MIEATLPLNKTYRVWRNFHEICWALRCSHRHQTQTRSPPTLHCLALVIQTHVHGVISTLSWTPPTRTDREVKVIIMIIMKKAMTMSMNGVTRTTVDTTLAHTRRVCWRIGVMRSVWCNRSPSSHLHHATVKQIWMTPMMRMLKVVALLKVMSERSVNRESEMTGLVITAIIHLLHNSPTDVRGHVRSQLADKKIFTMSMKMKIIIWTKIKTE